MKLTIEQIKQMSIEELEEVDVDSLGEKELKSWINRCNYFDPNYDAHLGCPNWPNCDLFGCGEC